MRRSMVLATSLFTLVALSALPAAAATFTKIAFTTNPAAFYGGGPAINNAGQVAFVFNDSNGATGVYRGTGGPVTPIATSATPGISAVVSHVSINDGGEVAFTAYTPTGTMVAKGSGGAVTPIDSSASGAFSYEAVSINSAGAVAFVKPNATTLELDTLYVGNGVGSPTPVVSASGPPHQSFGRLQMNDTGNIAFVSFLDAGGAAVYTTGSGSTGLAIPNTDIVGINNSDEVLLASGGTLYLDTPAGSPVVVVDGSAISVVMASLNNNGEVAVLGTAGAVLGIFTGPNPATDKVIALGDTLFGHTVTSLSIWREALNDSGDIAFAYGLDNLEGGIAVAHVPEPSLGLLLAAGLALIRSRRERR